MNQSSWGYGGNVSTELLRVVTERNQASWMQKQSQKSEIAVDSIEFDADGHHHEVMSDLSRDEVKARTEASEAKVAAAISDMRAENEKLRGDMAVFKHDILTAIEGVRTDHAKEQVVATRWQIGVLFSILIAAVSTIVTVVLRTSGSTPQQQSSTSAPQVNQPAPIIVTVPAYYPAPAAATTAGTKHSTPTQVKSPNR